MKPLLTDITTWEKLLEKGVVKIPFLSPNELEDLRQFYDSVHPTGVPPTLYDNIHMTTWSDNPVYKYSVKAAIGHYISPACQRNFAACRVLNQVFIVKMPGPETTFNIHQDWGVVDETRFPSLNVWIPLQDVDEKNGAMWIIEKSHRLPMFIRGAGQLFPDYRGVVDDLKPHMTSYPMKAGEALVFFHNTIHGSPPNNGNQPRIVAASGIVHKDCPLHIYYHPQGTEEIHVYEPRDDFAYNYNRLREESVTKAPAGQLLKRLPLEQFKQPKLEDILKAIRD